MKKFLERCIPILIIFICIFYFIATNKVSVKEENDSGDIQISCIDKNNYPVMDVKMILKNSNGENLKEIESDINGIAKLYGIEEGIYTIEIVKITEGYEINEVSKNIEVKSGELTEVTFEEEWTKGNILVTIVNDANKIIPGAVIEFYDSQGYIIKSVTTDENGKCSFDLDKNGTYYFKQISSVDNVFVDSTVYEFTINDENKHFYKTLTNERKKGAILMVVKYKDETVAEGIKYDILDENKEHIITITTNKKGLAGAKNLPLGTYYYQENLQQYDKEMHEFYIQENEEIVRRDIVLEN